MNLSYFIIHSGTGPLLWLINIIVYLIIAVIVWMIVKWAAAEFGVPPQIVKLLGLLLFLLLIISLFVGCSSYQQSVASRSVGLQGSVTDSSGSGKIIYTVNYK